MAIDVSELGLNAPKPWAVARIQALTDVAARPGAEVLVVDAAPGVGWRAVVTPIDRSRAAHPLGAIDEVTAELFDDYSDVHIAIAHNDYDPPEVEMLESFERSVSGQGGETLDNGWRLSSFNVERPLAPVVRELARAGVAPQIVVSPLVEYLCDLTWTSGILWFSPSETKQPLLEGSRSVAEGRQLRPLVRDLIESEI